MIALHKNLKTVDTRKAILATLFVCFAFVFRIFKRFALKLQTVAQLFDFYVFARITLNTKVFPNRETLYNLILSDITENAGIHHTFLEFGVAQGYTTHYFSSRLDKSKIEYKYYGFDTFLGLPQDWRNFKKGSFTNEGNPPSLKSTNVEFFKGFVQDTLPVFLESKLRTRTKTEKFIILFDLDLLSPTRFCFDSIMPFLLSGDLLYFDEAFDVGERSIIEELMNENKEIEIIAASIQSLLIRKK